MMRVNHQQWPRWQRARLHQNTCVPPVSPIPLISESQAESWIALWTTRIKNFLEPKLRSFGFSVPFLSRFRFNRFVLLLVDSGCKAQLITCYVFNGFFYLFAPLPMSRRFLFYRASINLHFPLWFQFFLSFWWWLLPSVEFTSFYVCPHPLPVTWRVAFFCCTKQKLPFLVVQKLLERL